MRNNFTKWRNIKVHNEELSKIMTIQTLEIDPDQRKHLDKNIIDYLSDNKILDTNKI